MSDHHEGFTGQSPVSGKAHLYEFVPVESERHGNIFIKAVVNTPGSREPGNEGWQDETTIATVWDASDGCVPDWKDEQRANARLLAAAPAMYHALRCVALGTEDCYILVLDALEQAESVEIVQLGPDD